jgi:hypothetical protein
MRISVEILPSGRRARLIVPFIVDTSIGTITVPKGFETDFASVPRFFWRIIPPWGKYSPAAVVHDYLYFNGECGKKKADQVFLELMKRLGVSSWKRRVMFYAVSWFGGSAWDNHRERGAS